MRVSSDSSSSSSDGKRTLMSLASFCFRHTHLFFHRLYHRLVHSRFYPGKQFSNGYRSRFDLYEGPCSGFSATTPRHRHLQRSDLMVPGCCLICCCKLRTFSLHELSCVRHGIRISLWPESTTPTKHFTVQVKLHRCFKPSCPALHDCGDVRCSVSSTARFGRLPARDGVRGHPTPIDCSFALCLSTLSDPHPHLSSTCLATMYAGITAQWCSRSDCIRASAMPAAQAPVRV